MNGIHFAMSFLERWQRVLFRVKISPGDPKITELPSTAALQAAAKDKRVVILGGGDTGVDCIATSLRQVSPSYSFNGLKSGFITLSPLFCLLYSSYSFEKAVNLTLAVVYSNQHSCHSVFSP